MLIILSKSDYFNAAINHQKKAVFYFNRSIKLLNSICNLKLKLVINFEFELIIKNLITKLEINSSGMVDGLCGRG